MAKHAMISVKQSLQRVITARFVFAFLPAVATKQNTDLTMQHPKSVVISVRERSVFPLATKLDMICHHRQGGVEVIPLAVMSQSRMEVAMLVTRHTVLRTHHPQHMVISARANL